MINAKLNHTRLVSADLRGAVLRNAVLDYSLLAGTPEDPISLSSANVEQASNNGGAIRHADLRQMEFGIGTDFRNVFLDGTVRLGEDFRAQMHHPCQWIDEVLSDDEFYSRWRWWIEQRPSIGTMGGWDQVAPPGYADIEPIPLGKDCRWNTDPYFPGLMPL